MALRCRIFAFETITNLAVSAHSRSVFVLAVLLPFLSCSPRLTVMSFNVRQSHVREADPANNWKNRKEACLEMLRIRRPDLVGFQEAQFKDQWPFFRDSLASEYGGVIGRDNGVDKGETSGFLYKKSVLTLLDSGTFWVSETPEKPSVSFDEKYNRSLTWGLFKVNKTGKRFYYFNTHLGLTWKSQKEGIELIVKKMHNAHDIAPVTDYIPTYNAWGNKQKERIIDFIWITPDIKCLEYHTDTTSYGGHELISDHYPIRATIAF